eukprot:SAG31_NODE_426_length_15814_cov_25.737066_7_plen_1209_part_00
MCTRPYFEVLNLLASARPAGLLTKFSICSRRAYGLAGGSPIRHARRRGRRTPVAAPRHDRSVPTDSANVGTSQLGGARQPFENSTPAGQANPSPVELIDSRMHATSTASFVQQLLGLFLSSFPLLAESASSEYAVDGAQLGPSLHSVGAQSTAGTARLLVDYPPVQREQVLDLLFRPQYGASLQHLKVEIGGDAQISSGAEASPMRSPPTAGGNAENNFNRGYEHWLMAEAKKRNPDIILLGLVYAWPDWINPAGKSPYESAVTEQNAATYVASWVSGVRRSHNLTIDWVGCWYVLCGSRPLRAHTCTGSILCPASPSCRNEREYTTSYIKTLRKALDAHGHGTTKIVASDRDWEPISSDFLKDPDLRSSVDALTQHYPHCDASNGAPGKGKGAHCGASNQNALAAHREYGVQLWSSEDYSCWTDSQGAGVWASEINSQYIGGNITMVSAWHLVSAFYPTVAFWNEGMMSATEPWSGYFVASPTLWASAHTTQFTRPGMRYLPQGKGAGELAGGGTYVSFFDPQAGDLTIVIETAGPAIGSFCDSNCNGKCMFTAAPTSQTVTFVLSNLKLRAATTKLVHWQTRLGLQASQLQLFKRMQDVQIVNGTVSVVVDSDSVVTLSTVRTATKAGDGTVLESIPASKPFPLPYSDDFEASQPPSVGKYWSDMDGGFEVATSGIFSNVASKNQVLKQTVFKPACCNFIPKLDGPLPVSIIGSSSWENVEASISIALPKSGGFALFGIRAKYAASSFFNGGLGKPTGIFGAIDEKGWQLLPSVVAAATGLSWPPAASCLASGVFLTPGTGIWREVKLSIMDRNLTYAFDTATHMLVLPDTVGTGSGFVAVASSYSAVEFDNFTVAQVSTQTSRCGKPVKAGQQPVMVGCGDPAAAHGARWDIHIQDNRSGAGSISLRSDPSLCLARRATVAQTHDAAQLTWSGAKHAPFVQLSPNKKTAEWENVAPGRAACDTIALGSDSVSSYSVQLMQHGTATPAIDRKQQATYVDIGWCTPDIELSGKPWMGYQKGKAWVYRGMQGNFKAANGIQDQGQPYSIGFAPGSNVTAMRHNATLLEFFLNGQSRGLIHLPLSEIVPAHVVPCAGVCSTLELGISAGLAPIGPPIPPPPPPPSKLVLAKCVQGEQSQQFRYDPMHGGIFSDGEDVGGIVTGLGAAGDFSPTSIGEKASALWWSPDLGYIHGDSNRPMACNCIAVCGE